ncbi:MAG: KilA-N domain-containing protein [Deltaproteobacteria bacterium]|nr:KilA-N domain-containing protein [Deltaproteobacteria bacterium]
MAKRNTIEVQGTAICIISQPEGDYISLTDMVRNFDGGGALIEQWLKNKDTVLFLGVWERINNPGFNSLEFEGIKSEAGRNSFFLSAKKWIQLTGAKGLIASAGRYGGTYAHSDIALEFGSWLSPEFKLYLIKEFQRLKEDENRRLSLAWNLNRTLSKLNYRIHTDAIKLHLVPAEVSAAQAAITYANEADILNVALFGQTAREWRDRNPQADGNMRDYATVEQLLVLANIESMNAELIHMGLTQGERLKRLNEIAIRQMQVLTSTAEIKKLK